MIILQHIRERISLALLALLPLHALAVTILTKFIAGPGHAPLPYLAFWKEGVAVVLLIVAFVEWIRANGYKHISFDLLDSLLLALGVLAVLVTLLNGVSSKAAFVLGLKYDFFPLVLFFVLRRVDWSEAFKTKAMATLLLVGAIVSLYGILTFFLPVGFFTWLGYSDMHSLFLPDGPLAPFQLIGGSALHRIQSTMSGPNQLGIWLLIPLAVVVTRIVRERGKGKGEKDSSPISLLPSPFFLVIILIALFLTFSRASWIGAFVLLTVGFLMQQSRWVRRKAFFWGLPAALLATVLVAAIFPSVILRLSSTRGHLEKPLAGIRAMIDDPLGRGLGSAGPATNRTSDACVELEKGSDATWAQAHPDLCVFVGGEQVQPAERVCTCPFVTENWYIQIGVELGILGFAIFVAFIVLLLRALRRNGDSLAPFLGMLGISLCALFLHAFEDSAVAYSAFLLAAFFLPAKREVSQR